MTHGSLFSGIGGFEIGAYVNDISTIYNCEIEDFQGQILNKYFNKSKHYEDIKTINDLPYVDIITGGFPCQDISVAGKGEGIRGKRSGLWDYMAGLIRATRPKYIIIENSPMLLKRGFERVLHDLSKSGYNAEWQCITNASFGFPHKRERLYVIAYDSDKIGRPEVSFFSDRSGETEGAFNWEFSGMFSPTILLENYAEFLRMDNGISDNVHRLESIGNAVNPYIAAYLFYLVKRFDKFIAS